MIETISVKIDGKEYEYSKGITLLEIANELEKNYKHPILLAKVNNAYKELSAKLKEDAEIDFIDLTRRFNFSILSSYISLLYNNCSS